GGDVWVGGGVWHQLLDRPERGARGGPDAATDPRRAARPRREAQDDGLPGDGRRPVIERRIVGFHQDGEGQWVAELECGHGLHVRHDPPWYVREWTQSEAGRDGRLGTSLP